MASTANITTQCPEAFPDWRYDHIEVEYDRETASVWMNYKADSPPCYTLQTLEDMLGVRNSLQALFASGRIKDWPIKYFVMASKKRNVFSLGGDLETFASCIRQRQINRLLYYAHVCIELIHSLSKGLDLPIVTVAAVHGQCLGGGFEAALASDYIIAEANAKFGVPEVSFNSFPGMGAVTLLARRVGGALTERIVSGGAVYSGKDMYDLDVVDVLTPEGELRNGVRSWMLQGGEDRWRKRRAITQARLRSFPVTRVELDRITELWAECASRIGESDLRHMERLSNAQKRLIAK